MTDERESLKTVGELIEILKQYEAGTELWVAIHGQYHRLNTVVTRTDGAALLAPHYEIGDRD